MLAHPGEAGRGRWVERLRRAFPARRIFPIAGTGRGTDRIGEPFTHVGAVSYTERSMSEWDNFDLDEPPMPSITVARRVLRTVLLTGMTLALVLTVVVR